MNSQLENVWIEAEDNTFRYYHSDMPYKDYEIILKLVESGSWVVTCKSKYSSLKNRLLSTDFDDVKIEALDFCKMLIDNGYGRRSV